MTTQRVWNNWEVCDTDLEAENAKLRATLQFVWADPCFSKLRIVTQLEVRAIVTKQDASK